MAGGTAFAEHLTRWIISHYPDDLARLVVFVPTARVAARVRALLSIDMTGVLPAILPLKGNGELADLLGIRAAIAVDEVAAHIEIAGFLKRLGGGEAAAERRQEAVGGERLWRRARGLYATLDMLARHGLAVKDLRRTVPPQMVGLWEAQAATLIAVAAHMEHWLARRNEIWPGDAERRVLERAAEVLAEDGCRWIPVVAGELDGTPAAHEVMRAAAARGRVLVPGFEESGTEEPRNYGEGLEPDGGETGGSRGSVTAQLVGRLEERLGIACETLAVGEGEVALAVAETEWDEAWLAALAVRRAKADGLRRVAVVSPSRTLLKRVAEVLARWGLVVPVGGAACLDQTPAGRATLAVLDRAGPRRRDITAVMAELEGALGTMEGFGAIRRALGSLHGMTEWLDGDDWRAVAGLTLARTAAAGGVASEGIALLGALDARLMDFDYVVAAGAVEGIWPGASHDAWLSEAHLRALGLPDAAQKALLAGTEFESAVHGNPRVLVTLSRTVEGREAVRSRYLGSPNFSVAGLQEGARELGEALEALRHGGDVWQGGVLGVFRPGGKLWPKRWSASLIEAMLACPYKALGERVLRLAPPEPLTPEPDARMAGLLAHRWLEKAGKEIAQVTEATAEQAVKRLLDLAAFELRHEPPVVRAVWTAKFAKLAPALVAQWLADGRRVAAVEQRLAENVGAVTVTATLDRVEAGPQGTVIVDFKTSTAPGWSDVASGVKPQLAIEAWLLGQQGGTVDDVEYWQLRGYGPNPLQVSRPGKRGVEELVAPVADGLARLAIAHGEGGPFPAVPDMAGGGLVATGHCARCALAGVCRRKCSVFRV